MNNAIIFPSESENLLIESLYDGIQLKNHETLKAAILNIPKISTLDRVNFYFFRKYAITLVDGIETFEENHREELRDTCLKVKMYS